MTVRFEECNDWLILINYGHNQTVRFRERRSQSLIKVGQNWLNLIDSPKTTGLGENHIQTFITGIEEYDDVFVMVKFETNWMVRLR